MSEDTQPVQSDDDEHAQVQAFAGGLAATVIEAALNGKMPPYQALLGLCLAVNNVALSICGGDQTAAGELANEAWTHVKMAIGDPTTEVNRSGSVSVDETTEGGLVLPANDGLIH